MATKTTAKKTAPSTITQSADIQLTLTQIVWPLWFKVAIILTGIYSALMIMSFFFTLFVMVTRQSHGF